MYLQQLADDKKNNVDINLSQAFKLSGEYEMGITTNN